MNNTTWLLNSPNWNLEHHDLIKLSNRERKSSSVNEIINKTENFVIQFPIKSVCMKSLLDTVPQNILERNVRSAYPLIHEVALYLIAEFLLFKQKHGSKIEKQIYKNMTIIDFIDRLLLKRCICFFGFEEYYMLRNGKMGHNMQWYKIGTDSEEHPFLLKDYLSYDELKISALLSVSSYSYFVNNGRRMNGGCLDSRDTIEPEGVIINLIGPRLEKFDVMEAQEIILNEENLVRHRGRQEFYRAPTINKSKLDELFFKFYEETKYSYNDIKNGRIENITRFEEVITGTIFDNNIYAKRLAISFDTLLIEANHRAQEIGKYAYVHVVGFGLGNFHCSRHQENVFVKVFGDRIRLLGSNLNFISDIDLSYFSLEDESIQPIENHPLGGIKIRFSKRQSFSKLETNDKLLVISYAGESNALPGNDFWVGSQGESSDSATACSSQISELHNPYFNSLVSANNLKVVTSRGLLPVQYYFQEVITKISSI